VPICGWDLFDVSIEFSRKLHSPSYLFAINRRSPDHPPNDPFDSIVACGCFTIDDRDTSFSFHSIHHPAGMSCKGLTVAFFLSNRKKKNIPLSLVVVVDDRWRAWCERCKIPRTGCQ
jgi:hypothetical protein